MNFLNFFTPIYSEHLVLYLFDDEEYITDEELNYLFNLSKRINKLGSFVEFTDYEWKTFDVQKKCQSEKLILKSKRKIISIAFYDKNPLKGAFGFKITYSKTLNPSYLILQRDNTFSAEIDYIDIVKFFKPIYGFKYTCKKNNNSSLYAIKGYSSKSSKILEVKAIFETQDYFFGNRKNFKLGFLRDVYQFNIISEIHLNKDYHGITLREIIMNNNLGVLHEIFQMNYLWTLNASQVTECKKILFSLLSKNILY